MASQNAADEYSSSYIPLTGSRGAIGKDWYLKKDGVDFAVTQKISKLQTGVTLLLSRQPIYQSWSRQILFANPAYAQTLNSASYSLEEIFIHSNRTNFFQMSGNVLAKPYGSCKPRYEGEESTTIFVN